MGRAFRARTLFSGAMDSLTRRNLTLSTLALAALIPLAPGCRPRDGNVPTDGPTPAVVAEASGYTFPNIAQRRPAPGGRDNVDAAETAAAGKPEDADAQRRLGLAYYGSGGFRAAANALEKALAVRPDDGVAWLYLGFARMGVGQPERAIEALEKAATSDLPARQRAAARTEIGSIYYQALRDDSKAMPAFREALRLNPSEGAAALALGTDAAQKKDAAGARKMFQTAAAALPAGADRASVYACLGRLAEEKKDLAGARGYYEKALKDDPGNAWAKVRLPLMRP